MMTAAGTTERHGMIEATWELIVVIIGIALVFDFTNGFHDSANSISTVVSTKVLSPRSAVVFAAFFNFVAAFAFGVAVASTISKIIQLEIVETAIIPFIILAALIGAISWNLITWFFGLPTSSSHALIGGMTGAGLAAAGIVAIKWSTVGQVALFMILSPLIGLACGFLFMAVILNLTKNADKAVCRDTFQTSPALFRSSLQFQPRHQRCPEDHGDYRPAPLLDRVFRHFR